MWQTLLHTTTTLQTVSVHTSHLVWLYFLSGKFSSWGKESFFRVLLLMTDSKLANVLGVASADFYHPEAWGTCGLHNADGWWILVKLISGTVLTPSNFSSAHSHYYSGKSFPDCKADAWISHRAQKCPAQCGSRSANELLISYYWHSILPLNLK